MTDRQLQINGTFWRVFSTEKTLFRSQDIEFYVLVVSHPSNQEIYLNRASSNSTALIVAIAAT